MVELFTGVLVQEIGHRVRRDISQPSWYRANVWGDLYALTAVNTAELIKAVTGTLYEAFSRLMN